MQTRKALKRLSNERIQYDQVTPDGPLAQNASWLLQRHAEQQESIDAAQQRHEIASSLPVLEAARQKLVQIIGERVLPDDTPIAMRFDVYNVLKQACKGQKDIGLKRLATHLERLWHEEPLGTISAGAMTRLRDHYQSENPRSVVGSVIDELVPKISFNNLPVAQLSRIAAEIDSQEDYDIAIVRHGLHRDNIRNIRARTFVRELVNRKAMVNEAGEQLVQDSVHMGSAKQNQVGVTANRVMNRLAQEAQDFVSESDTEAGPDTDDAKDPEKSGLGVGGTGVLPTTVACLKEQEELQCWAASTGAGIPKEAVAPPGWEETVKEMKGKEGIEDPFALAWWMKGKGYTPGGKNGKEAQTPYGQPWSSENVMEIANDIMSEMGNPEVAQLADKIVQEFAKSQQMQPPQPGSKEFGELLAYGLQEDPATQKKIQSIIYKSMMGETEEEMYAQQPSQAPGIAQEEPALVPTTAAKKEKKNSGPSQPEFQPKINQQQPPQESIKPGDGLKVLKAYAIPADHPLVDDDQDHFPIFSKEQHKLASQAIGGMEKAPVWWLGSVAELSKTIEAAIKQAGDIPPEFLENVKKKKDESGDEKKEKEASSNPFEIAATRGFSAKRVEEGLVSGQTMKFNDFVLRVADNRGRDILQLDTKSGYRQYQLIDMDAAISDFMYLVGTDKVTNPSPPMFFIREGIRLPCPGCGGINSYNMPKQAMDLACDGCHTVFPADVVEAAFNVGAAREETALVVFTPISLQQEFGEKFAQAAEMMGADSVEAEGCRAEAYTVSPPNEKMAEVWDFLIEAGFKPLAKQAQGMPAPPPAPSGGGEFIAQGPEMDMPPLDITKMPSMGEEPPMEEPMMGEEAPSDILDIGDPTGDAGYADHQMIQAAMMYYQSQGNGVTEAVTQFTKDFGDGYDGETVMQVAATVFGIQLDQIKVAMQRNAGDLPSTKVNVQQPDAVSLGKGEAVLGPDSETHGEIPTVKGKPQSKPQGTFSDTSTEPDSDNKDPGSFGAPKPKAQHPATEQQGTSTPSTEGPAAGLGSDSETQMGGTMKKMDTESSGAHSNVRSAGGDPPSRRRLRPSN